VGVGLGRVNRSNGLEIETRIVSRIDPGSLSSARFHRIHLMQALCQSVDAFICMLHQTIRQQKLPERNPLRAKRDPPSVVTARLVCYLVYWPCCILSNVPTEADPILSAFYDTGAYLQGHFRLTSGLHSPEYLQCARVLQHPCHAEHFGRLLATEFRRLEPTTNTSIVVSPAIGGLIIGHEVARALGARFIFTERDASGKMVLRRGFSVEPGETAVVVEDVITTGGSSREVIDILKESGARVLAAGSIIDRSGGAVDLGVPRVALKTLEVIAYAAEDCPLCRSGSPVIKPGSRPVHAAN
jgi:orotate phosphoribosyltransferase